MEQQIALIISLLLLLHPAKSEDNLVRDSLLNFLSKLSNNKSIPAPAPGWNSTSDPCTDNWRGVTCQYQHVRAIDLHSLRLQGVFDPATLCNSLSHSLSSLTLSSNSLRVANFAAIANCSALTIFLVQRNNFSGEIPDLDFSRFQQFNLSVNNLSGQIPARAAGLPPSSFLDNPELCGAPLPTECPWMADSESAPVPPMPPPPPPQLKHHKGGISNDQILMYIGYVAIAFVVVLLLLLWVRKKSRRERDHGEDVDGDNGVMKRSFSTVELKAAGGVLGKGNVEYSSMSMSTSLVVLTSPEVNGMRFEDLLKAPAELVGRGSHGSVYKVVYEEKGMALAVKRIKDWQISTGEFRQRMRRLNQVKHPTVMPALAYYSSGQEKLIVYEYHHNGSLFNHIHANGNGNREAMEWSSRLFVAASVADALAYMHDELQYDRIPHGNLKSSNILFNSKMEPSISEYGLMLVEGEGHRGGILANGALEEAQEDYKAIFKEDSYAFGVILLELLTGRMVLTEGLDLASWVVAAVREEWTVEVFDKDLMREGVNEERMVNLLQIAIRCVAKPPGARPSMRQVALALGAIREEDERSLDVSQLSVTRSFVAL